MRDWLEVERRIAGGEDGRRLRSGVETAPAEMPDPLSGLRFRLTEEQIVPAADLAHLDASRFERFLVARGFRTGNEPQPATVADWRNFRVVREYDGKHYPTLYGILRFGRTPQAHPYTTSFLVRCAAYAGDDRGTEVILAGEADGPLDEQVRRALGWFRSLGWREKYEGVEREDIPRLPPEALREALVNAVAHRDYTATGSAVLLDVFADRAEITSPGTLPNRMTVEAVKVGGGPRSRNEMLAHFLVEAGLMEKRGRGWFVMRNAMRDFNGTEPELINSTEGDLVRLTLRFAPPDGKSVL